MAINSSQLLTWTHAPGSTKSQYTYQQIKLALQNSPALRDKNFEIYLQGSYANSTNIKVDSDIDVVIELKSSFTPNTSRLTEPQKSFFTLAYPTNATYLWPHFRQDVINALNTHFGQAKIKPGSNSVHLIGDVNLLNADIIPCLEYRYYTSFDILTHGGFIRGVRFLRTDDNREIINYPKIHIENGEAKNATHRTDDSYKNIVRIVKNIKRRLVEDHSFNPELAPSYFVECAVYNVPDGHFSNNHQTSLEYALNHILHEREADQFLTVSQQHDLFGTEPWQWNTDDAVTFFTAAKTYYDNN